MKTAIHENIDIAANLKSIGGNRLLIESQRRYEPLGGIAPVAWYIISAGILQKGITNAKLPKSTHS